MSKMDNNHTRAVVVASLSSLGANLGATHLLLLWFDGSVSLSTGYNAV